METDNFIQEKIYQEAKLKFLVAKTEADYKESMTLFFKIPGYKDANELKKKCMQQAQLCKEQEINNEIQKNGNDGKTLTNKKKKQIKIISIAAGCLAIIIALIVGLNAIICTNVRSSLIGRTFKGSCIGSYLKWNVEISFTDKNHCEIDFDYYLNDTNYGGTYVDVPYSVSGGVFGVKLVWDDDIGPDNGAEPFVLEKSGDKYILYTPNWDSHMSMSLYEW